MVALPLSPTLVEGFRPAQASVAFEDVWAAFASPDRLGRWFLPVSGDFRLGGSYQFEGNAGGRNVAQKETGKRTARFEGAGVLQAFELELQRETCQTEVFRPHLQNGRDAHVRGDGPGCLFDLGACDGHLSS